MLETISEFIDLEILLLIFMALFSFIVLKFIYRKISFPKILQVFITLIVVCANIYFVYSYFDNAEHKYMNIGNEYYITGNVRFVSNAIDKVRIEYNDTNIVIEDSDNKNILIKINAGTKIYNKSGEKITLNEIKNGDNIRVKTSKGTIKSGTNEITANSIYKY